MSGAEYPLPPYFMLRGRRTDAGGIDRCGCYPECRIDCADREQCLTDMPEYQSKLDRARRYAAEVRRRNPGMQVRAVK